MQLYLICSLNVFQMFPLKICNIYGDTVTINSSLKQVFEAIFNKNWKFAWSVFLMGMKKTNFTAENGRYSVKDNQETRLFLKTARRSMIQQGKKFNTSNKIRLLFQKVFSSKFGDSEI